MMCSNLLYRKTKRYS